LYLLLNLNESGSYASSSAPTGYVDENIAKFINILRTFLTTSCDRNFAGAVKQTCAEFIHPSIKQISRALVLIIRTERDTRYLVSSDVTVYVKCVAL